MGINTILKLFMIAIDLYRVKNEAIPTKQFIKNESWVLQTMKFENMNYCDMKRMICIPYNCIYQQSSAISILKQQSLWKNEACNNYNEECKSKMYRFNEGVAT